MNHQLEADLGRAMTISRVFIAWNLAWFGVTLAAAGTIAGDVLVLVLVRGAVFAAAGLVLVALVRGMAQGKRSSWLRLRIISTLAPLGVAAFLVFTPGLPLWFDAAQLGSGLMLVGLAFVVWREDVRMRFRKGSAAEPLSQPGGAERSALDGGAYVAG